MNKKEISKPTTATDRGSRKDAKSCVSAARRFATVIGILCLCLATSGTALAQSTGTVTNTNNTGDGSLRQAINNVANGGTITFDASLAGQTITLASTLTINTSVTIEGNGITLSGNNACKIMGIDAS
ncbi:MAG: hypothetical protein LBS05_08845, partial [Tannerellaceae bacterium]|nr:hypothetical protein [Tannerellaceae bacterium]